MLLDGALGFAMMWVSFLDISMLLYGKTMKMAEFGQTLDISKNDFFAIEIEPQDQSPQNFRFTKQKKLLTDGEKNGV